MASVAGLSTDGIIIDGIGWQHYTWFGLKRPSAGFYHHFSWLFWIVTCRNCVMTFHKFTAHKRCRSSEVRIIVKASYVKFWNIEASYKFWGWMWVGHSARGDIFRRLRARTAGNSVRYHSPWTWNSKSSSFGRRGEQKNWNKSQILIAANISCRNLLFVDVRESRDSIKQFLTF